MKPIVKPDQKKVDEANKQHIKSLRVAKREILQMLRDEDYIKHIHKTKMFVK